MTDCRMRPATELQQSCNAAATELRIVKGAPKTKPERTSYTDIQPTERHANTEKDRDRQTDREDTPEVSS
jgi:hypothetical protein